LNIAEAVAPRSPLLAGSTMFLTAIATQAKLECGICRAQSITQSFPAPAGSVHAGKSRRWTRYQLINLIKV